MSRNVTKCVTKMLCFNYGYLDKKWYVDISRHLQTILKKKNVNKET